MPEIEKSNAIFDACAKLELMQSLTCVSLDVAEEGGSNPMYLADMLRILLDGICFAKDKLQSYIDADTKGVVA